jgi:uncharacterized membrane protein
MSTVAQVRERHCSTSPTTSCHAVSTADQQEQRLRLGRRQAAEVGAGAAD